MKKYSIYISFMGEEELDSTYHDEKEAKEKLEVIKKQNQNLGVPANVFIREEEGGSTGNDETPLVCVFENNGWEGERWRIWFPESIYKGNENLYKRVRAVLEKVSPVDQVNGSTYFGFEDKPVKHNQIDWEKQGYMEANVLSPNGEVVLEKLEELETKTAEDLDEVLYKSGLRGLFVL